MAGCCCRGRRKGVGNFTLRKVRVSDGAVIWAADRGAVSASIAVDASGAIYEGGSRSPPSGVSFHHVTKWTDDGAFYSRQWNFQAAVNANVIRLAWSADDDVLWSNNVSRIERVNTSSGAQLNEMSPGAASSNLFDASGGNVIYTQSVAATRLLDDTLAEVTIIDHTNLPVQDVSGTTLNIAGWYDPGALGIGAFVTDDDLNVVASDAGISFGSAGGVFARAFRTPYVLFSTSSAGAPPDFGVSLHDSETLDEIWAESSHTMDVAAIDSEGNVYAYYDADNEFYRLSGADGSEDWLVTSSPGTPGSSTTVNAPLISEANRLVILTGAFTVNGISCGVVAHDMDDGSIRWVVPLSANARAFSPSGEYIYVCGGRHSGTV